MEKIIFNLEKESFQKASFRKYLNELKDNKSLQRGGMILLFFTLTIFLLSFIINNSIFQYFSIFIQILFFLVVLLLVGGVYSTWKDGKKDFNIIFKGDDKLLFSYNAKQFVYGSLKENRSYNWEFIKSSFFLHNINIVILEDKEKGQFFINLTNKKIEDLKVILTQNGISITYI